jgi:hypothetical protein
MTITLHLGVISLPYANTPRGRRSKARSGTQNTVDVAEILESKYHVMESFAQLHLPDIAKSFENAAAGALETLMQGGPQELNLGSATSDIEKMFHTFIDQKEMDKLGYPGVPTAASLKGVSARFANRKGVPGRPSFQSSGLYESSFKAWTE